MQGWIKLYRELGDKPIWLESTPEQKVILITLLMMANHDSKEWEWMGRPYKAEAGQFVTSLQKIAAKSGKGISIQNVRTALKRFEKYDFLTDESTKVNRLITIVNWGFYQGSADKANKVSNSQLTDDQQSANSQLTTNKNVRTKEGKNEELKDNTSNQDSTEAIFGEVWKIYPKKTMRKEALAAFKKELKKGTDPEIIKSGIESYLLDLKANSWKKPMDGGRWFQKERWNDDYDNQNSFNVARVKSDEEKMLDELSRQRLANIPIPDDSEFPF